MNLHVPPFAGVRSDRYTYVRYDDGDRDLYDLAADPQQLQDIAASASTTLLASLDRWLHAMRKCKGEGCRLAEMSDPVGE